MNRQIVIIHGGQTYPNYQSYINSLKNRKVTVQDFKYKKDWKIFLQENLKDNFDFFFPKMPNSFNARYKEWKIWFERMSQFLQDNTIFIGHSLGGIFLAKYFSENNFSKKIKAVILVSAPWSRKRLDKLIGSFALPSSLKKFSDQVKDIYLIYAKDDPVVPFSHLTEYQKALSKAKTVLFKTGGHFNQEFFPEIAEIIKNL